jgi:hypothetical protein
VERNPCWEDNNHKASEEIPLLLWNLKVHYRVHKGPPQSVSWASWIQSTSSYPISVKSTLILSSHLRLGIKIVYSFQISQPKVSTHFAHMCYMSRLSHFPWFYHPKIFREQYKIWRSSCFFFFFFLHFPITSSLLGLNILLTLCSQTSSGCWSYLACRFKINHRGKLVCPCLTIEY